jgi:hypothetical protein
MKTSFKNYDPDLAWNGPKRQYDLIKELVVAILVVGVLSIGLATLFSSPDDRAITLKSWASHNPADFVRTTTGELSGTTTSASYGPPYNTNGDGQKIGFVDPSKWLGVHIPINSAIDFVIKPLLQSNINDSLSLVSQWNSANASQQNKWATGYSDALNKDPKVISVTDPSGKYGPVPGMVNDMYIMAKSGALDGALTSSDSPLPTNFTKPLLFLADGSSYFSNIASKNHLQGGQMGVMNETGSWPGQSWLWLFSFWYQVAPFNTSPAGDLWVAGIMALMTLGLLLVPFIPIVRRVPYWIPLHKLIWRNWYRNSASRE